MKHKPKSNTFNQASHALKMRNKLFVRLGCVHFENNAMRALGAQHLVTIGRVFGQELQDLQRFLSHFEIIFDQCQRLDKKQQIFERFIH
jgi:hypothetical protein